MRRWEENGSWSQSVLGSNPVSAWETLTEPPGISEPRSLLRRVTHPSFPTLHANCGQLHHRLRLPCF